MRPQYHFRSAPNDDLLAWDVANLTALATELEVRSVSVDIANIREFDEAYWYDLGGDKPTRRSVVAHLALIAAADVTWPILLDVDGRVMDGMHRICKAHTLGHTCIIAHRFKHFVPPHFIDNHVDELPTFDDLT